MSDTGTAIAAAGGAGGGGVENITVIGHRRRDPNRLVLIVNGKAYAGWIEQRVTRGVERMPGDFEVSITERYPGLAQLIQIEPGDACVVMIGADTVITGWVDRYTTSISPRGHEVRITGRGKCCDLVDCAAGVVAPGNSIGGQYAASTVPGLLSAIAAPFGITVDVTDWAASSVSQVPQFSINLGETPFEIIDRVARWAGCLAYEGADGNLVVATAGSTRAASGFVQGTNVMSMSGTRTIDERFSVYLGSVMSVDNIQQVRSAVSGNFFDATVYDAGVTRFRPKVIVSEQMQNGQEVCKTRAIWEEKRRYGRSQQVTVVVDSWRDSAGTLWTPNTLAMVSLPSIKMQPADPWVIGEVTYSRGKDGTSATLTLMPPDAYSPEPSVLTAVDLQVAQALPGGGGAAISP